MRGRLAALLVELAGISLDYGQMRCWYCFYWLALKISSRVSGAD